MASPIPHADETGDDQMAQPLSRRVFLGSASAAWLATIVGSKAAARSSLVVPRVDRLVLQVIVDNATFGPFLPDQDLPGLRVERGGRGGGARMPVTPLMAEFGLSILARSRLGAQTRDVLVDFGYSAEVLANNLALLEIDPERLDASVLSHGHLDHYGGFRGLLASGSARTPPLPVIVGGEGAVCERGAAIGDPPPDRKRGV